MAKRIAKPEREKKSAGVKPSAVVENEAPRHSASAPDLVGLCRPFSTSFPIPVLVLDASSRVISASEAAGALLGRPLSDVIGAVFTDLLSPPRDRNACSPAFFSEALKRSGESICTIETSGKDGANMVLEIAANPFTEGSRKLLFVAVNDITEKRNAERELSECTEKYEALFENLNRGVVIYEAVDGGRDFVIKDFNRSAETMERVKRGEVVGKSVTETFPGIKELGLLEVLRRVWRTGKQEHQEPAVYEDARLGRSWRKNDVYKLPTGEVVCVYVDVTDRMEMLRKLEEGEFRYRALFENMRSGVAVYEAIDNGGDFIIKEFNHAAERNDKVKRNDVVGKPVTQVFPGADKIGFIDVLRRVWTTGKAEYFPPTLYEDKRIGTVWWEDYVYKLPTGELIATFENITERMKAVEDLRRSVSQVIAERDKIDTIVQSIADAVFVVDKNDAIILFNEAAAELTGVSVSDALGKPFDTVFSFVQGEGDRRADGFIKAARETGIATSASGDVILVSRDDRRIPVAPSASPLKTAEGVTGAVVVFRDVSDERAVDKLKSEYASITSRQLHTPLTNVRWFLELMLKGKAGELPPKAKGYLEQINATNERMIRLVDELLSIAKSESVEAAVPSAESVDVIEIIRDVIAENIDLIRENRVSVELNESLPKKLYLKIETKTIRDIFRHLISNAVKYSKASGRVDIAYDGERKDALLFSVKDSGYGIPARQQSRVFSRFFRADNIMTKVPEGTGLGLTAAKTSVESLGGKIWFTSIENVGSTFYFTLPKTMLPGKRMRNATERSANFAKSAREEGWLDAE